MAWIRASGRGDLGEGQDLFGTLELIELDQDFRQKAGHFTGGRMLRSERLEHSIEAFGERFSARLQGSHLEQEVAELGSQQGIVPVVRRADGLHPAHGPREIFVSAGVISQARFEGATVAHHISVPGRSGELLLLQEL